MRLTNLSFEEWIEHAFSREVRIQQAAWYFDPIHDLWDPKPVEAVAYLTRLFEDPERTLCWFSDDQIAQGLTYLVGTSGSGDNGWLSAMAVPVEARVRCVEAIGKLFDRLFAPRCTPHLSHLSEVAAGTLNCVCYMWWDEFPCIALPSDPNLRRLSGTALATMEHILGPEVDRECCAGLRMAVPQDRFRDHDLRVADPAAGSACVGDREGRSIHLCPDSITGNA